MLQMIPGLSKKKAQVLVQHSLHCSSLKRLYEALNDESKPKGKRVQLLQNGFHSAAPLSVPPAAGSEGQGKGSNGGGSASEGRQQKVLSAAIFNMMTSKDPGAHIGQIL